MALVYARLFCNPGDGESRGDCRIRDAQLFWRTGGVIGDGREKDKSADSYANELFHRTKPSFHTYSPLEWLEIATYR
jgi:hypothetical protein